MKFFRNQTTVDSILSAFNTTISALRKVEADQTAEAERQAAVAAAAAENAKVAAAEATRAGTIASRFEALVAEEVGE